MWDQAVLLKQTDFFKIEWSCSPLTTLFLHQAFPEDAEVNKAKVGDDRKTLGRFFPDKLLPSYFAVI